MSFVRVAAFRLPLRSRIASSARPLRSSNTFQRFGQQSQRKGYSSASDATKQSGSDLPWLIGAVAVTVPATWYILQPSAGHEGGHGDHDAHAKHDEAEDEKEESEEETKDDDESTEKKDDGEEDKDDGAEKKDDGEEKKDDGEEKKDDGEEKKDDGEEDKTEEKEDKKDGESDEKSEDKDQGEEGLSKSGNKNKDEGKPKTSGDDKSKDLGSPIKGEKKIEQDSKGATKKRIDSTQRKDVGEGKDGQASASSTGSDKNNMSDKQAGMSNTPTRHSTDPAAEGSGASKKGEGTAETAKITGTVDPGRKQV